MRITIENCRLSYPFIFKPKAYEQGDDEKYSAKGLLELDDPQIAKIKDALSQFARDNFDKKDLSKVKFCFNKIDIEDEEGEVASSVMCINASDFQRPHTLHRNLKPVSASDGVFYPGCYVNLSVSLWAQNNKFGKRVNANLLGVQFVGDGEQLGGRTPINPNDLFSAIGNDGGEESEMSEADMQSLL